MHNNKESNTVIMNLHIFIFYSKSTTQQFDYRDIILHFKTEIQKYLKKLLLLLLYLLLNSLLLLILLLLQPLIKLLRRLITPLEPK